MATMEINRRFLTCADTAKFVRKALKETFPTQQFSVRSRTYAGGASIDVRWTDGPTVREVESVTDRFRRSDFDGSTDMQEFRPAVLFADEDGSYEEVRFGADFISGDRRYSESALSVARERIEALSGRPFDNSEVYADVSTDNMRSGEPCELIRCSGHIPERGYTLVHQYLWGRSL